MQTYYLDSVCLNAETFVYKIPLSARSDIVYQKLND